MVFAEAWQVNSIISFRVTPKVKKKNRACACHGFQSGCRSDKLSRLFASPPADL